MKTQMLDTPVVLEPTVISIELTQDEAEIITMLLGKTRGVVSSPDVHDVTFDMYQKMFKLFPDYGTRFLYNNEEGYDTPRIVRR